MRRQHTRYDVDLQAEAATREAILSTRVLNISRGGLFLEPQQLPVESEVMMTLELGDPGGTVEALGQVAWSGDAELTENVSGSGIQFMWMSAHNRTQLRRFLDELEQSSSGPAPREDGPQWGSAQVQQAQKLASLGMLAGGVAHDLNNLLVAMLGHSSLALAKMSPDSSARQNLESVVQAAERASDLCRQMLAYAGRGQPEVGLTNLNELVPGILQLLRAVVPKSVQLSVQRSEEPALVRADLSQIQQVVMNLVLNGAEAVGDEPGSVIVRVGLENLRGDETRYSRLTAVRLVPGRYVLLEVRDDGAGMDERTRSQIFEPSFSTKLGDRGLGLSAVLGIVRAHRGGIDVESAPGNGTAFRLILPAVEESPATARAAAPAAAFGAGTVLVVDDEEVVRSTVGEILRAQGLRVLAAESGADGVALYRQGSADIDVVILDLSMPGMSGEETFRELRAIDPGARVVLSSGYGREEAIRRFQGLGLSGFIQKPCKPDVLLAEVVRHLGPS